MPPYGSGVPDPIFADPRLTPLYDELDGKRDDLDHYVAIAHELGARTVLDVGCGTGCLALRFAERGLEVTGVDPALASLEVAQAKSGSENVRWLHGDAATLPAMAVDLALMTGNVAQVFLSDQEWASTLRSISQALRPGGYLVFESRRPDYRAWEEWAREPAEVAVTSPELGTVTRRFTLTQVALPLVSFRYDYTFPDGTRIVSRSTLRFRSCAEFEESLTSSGFRTLDVRQAPDRPNREFVFVAQKVC